MSTRDARDRGEVSISFDATQIVAALRNWLGAQFPLLLCYVSGWQMRIQKPERVRHLDDANSSLALLLNNLIAQRLHSRPMDLWPEVMFCVITIVKPRPVIELSVGAHSPRNWFIGVASVMPVIAVQI